MVTLLLCGGHRTPFIPFFASGLQDPSIGEPECERSPAFGVLDGLVSVTRKAWFSRQLPIDGDE